MRVPHAARTLTTRWRLTSGCGRSKNRVRRSALRRGGRVLKHLYSDGWTWVRSRTSMAVVALASCACQPSPPTVCVEEHAWPASQVDEVDTQYAVLRSPESSVLRNLASGLTAPMLETRALVEAHVYDCKGIPASGVQVEVWNVRGDDQRFCTECRIVYSGESGAPDQTRTQLFGGLDAPAWIVLPPSDVLFIARDVATRRSVAVLGPVPVPIGWMRVRLNAPCCGYRAGFDSSPADSVSGSASSVCRAHCDTRRPRVWRVAMPHAAR